MRSVECRIGSGCDADETNRSRRFVPPGFCTRRPVKRSGAERERTTGWCDEEYAASDPCGGALRATPLCLLDRPSYKSMSNQSIGLSDELHEYLLSVSLRETEVMQRLRAETAEHPKSEMQIAPEQGQFLQFLVRLIGVRRTLEIGVFTGYSALAVAQELPSTGTLVACDVSEEYTEVARRYWEEAGVADRIDLRIAPAEETLSALIDDGQEGTFDFSFIDADKETYDTYYEQSLRLLRPGGVIALDNVFRGGRVTDSDVEDESVRAIQRLNEKLHDDERVDLSMLPLADGVTLAMKR